MLFSTVLTWLLVAVGFVVALPALWLLSRALWPASATRGRDAAAGGLLKLFLLGLVPVIGASILVTILGKVLHNGFLSALIGGLLLTWGFIGAGGIATLVGERLWPQLHVEPWRQTQRGGLVLVCCALLPLIGWVVLLPMLAILGWGVNARAFLSRNASADAAPAPVAPPIPS
ncbi:MAG: hypothetical protein H7A55_17870 [Verrucomicrobiaceae bacterium]|nr:hypothetical protein [Verrucomicrobiaceae bacterium]